MGQREHGGPGAGQARNWRAEACGPGRAGCWPYCRPRRARHCPSAHHTPVGLPPCSRASSSSKPSSLFSPASPRHPVPAAGNPPSSSSSSSTSGRSSSAWHHEAFRAGAWEHCARALSPSDAPAAAPLLRLLSLPRWGQGGAVMLAMRRPGLRDSEAASGRRNGSQGACSGGAPRRQRPACVRVHRTAPRVLLLSPPPPSHHPLPPPPPPPPPSPLLCPPSAAGSPADARSCPAAALRRGSLTPPSPKTHLHPHPHPINLRVVVVLLRCGARQCPIDESCPSDRRCAPGTLKSPSPTGVEREYDMTRMARANE